jgi:hypothetical protein
MPLAPESSFTSKTNRSTSRSSLSLREIEDGGAKVAPACGVRVLQHRFGLGLAEQPSGTWFMVPMRDLGIVKATQLTVATSRVARALCNLDRRRRAN